MRKILAKTMIIILIVLFTIEPLFAGGGKEDGKSETPTSTSGTNSGTNSATNSVNTTTGTTATGSQDYWLVANGDGTSTMVPYTNENVIPPGAIGRKTLLENGKVKVNYFNESESWLGEWIRDIANAIDQIVFRIALAIHPFPVSMFQLYGLSASRNNLHGVDLTMKPTEDKIHSFNTDYLLISNSYYSSRYLKVNDITVATEGVSVGTGNSLNDWMLPIAEDENSTGESMFEFTRWKTIVMLFATCFAAEILFMAIYGYATGSSEDGDSSLMKNVAKKIAITLMLMVLVSALPFLLEAFRVGLFEIAESFYGQAAYKSYSELAGAGYINAKDIPVDSNGRLTEKNIFKLPGMFLLSMRDMFARTTSDPMDKALSKQMTKSDANEGLRSLFVKLVVWILITIYRFLMFFVTLKATIHIAKNVLEVYLLLSLVMILVPFSVFTPLKTVGSKCVMSLVSNLVECFIILVIIITILPAIKVTIVTLLNYTIEITVSGTSEITATYQLGRAATVEKHNLKLVTGDRFVVLFAETGTAKDKMAICWTPVGADGSAAPGYEKNEDLKTVVKGEGAWLVMDISDLTASTESPYVKDTSIRKFYEIATPNVNPDTGNTIVLNEADRCITWGENGEGTYNSDTFSTALIKDAKKGATPALAENFGRGLMSALPYDWNSTMPQRETRTQDIWDLMVGEGSENAMMRQALAKLINPNWTDISLVSINDVSQPKEYASDGNTMTDDQITSAMFLQLTLVFLGLFLPSYFIQQSTQITNALMNGTAGMESIANAMEQTVSKAVGLTGKFLGMPFSLAGNIADAAMTGRRGDRSGDSSGSSGNASQTRNDASRSTQQSIVDTNNKNK